MSASVNVTRLRRGGSLIVLGVLVAASGLAAGTRTVGGFRLSLYGYLAVLAGIGYVGAAFVPLLVAYVGSDDATWENLSLLRQLVVLFVVALALFVVLIAFVTVIAPL